MKKFISILVSVCIMLASVNAFAMDFYNLLEKSERHWDESYTYNLPNGEEIRNNIVSEFKKDGFIPDYEVPEKDWVTLYAGDGRTMKTVYFLVDTYKNLGWYTDSLVTLYAWDGRSQAFPVNEVEAQLTVGWYKEPFVTLYAWDGRSEKFPQSEVAAQKTVGWYEKWELENLKAEQAEKDRKNLELAKNFYIGQRVCGSVFSYEWYGTVRDIYGGKILVNWDAFYDSYGFRITNQMEIISLEYALGIYINAPTWYDASQVYIAK